MWTLKLLVYPSCVLNLKAMPCNAISIFKTVFPGYISECLSFQVIINICDVGEKGKNKCANQPSYG